MSLSPQAKRARSVWGWGFSDEGPSDAALNKARQALFPTSAGTALEEPDWALACRRLRKPRFAFIECEEYLTFRDIISDDPMQRISHSFGKAYRDVVRALLGKFDNPPDYIAFPTSELQILALLRYCQRENIAIIPFGGGSSVVGGIEPPNVEQHHFSGVITLDMVHFAKVLSVDPISLTVTVQAGIYGPALLEQLKHHNLTLRHFPQLRVQYGWRMGGNSRWWHYATGRTHIDDFVQSIRMITPKGAIHTRRLPASGAGPQPERVVALGSEGCFGVITEVTLSVQKPVMHRVSAAVYFDNLFDGAAAVREIVQSGYLLPSNLRLVDPIESFVNGLAPNLVATLIIGFEAAESPGALSSLLSSCVEIAKRHGGMINEKRQSTEIHSNDAVDTWKDSFLKAPYLRDHLAKLGCILVASIHDIIETFETCCNWDQFADLHSAMQNAITSTAPDPERCVLTCRFTHVYASGPAPYFTVIAAATLDRNSGKSGAVEQWDAIKRAASEVLLRFGGTITHHHAVGRVHREFFLRESDSLFVHSLVSLKSFLDPRGIMNPGVLLPDSGHSPVAKL